MPWDERDEEGQGGSIEYVFSIASSKAGFTEYNQGQTCLLILEGEKEFTNGRVMDDNLWVNTPEGWTCTDDGSFFVSPDQDPDRRFDKRAKIQQLITSAIKAGVPLKERGENALDARAWAGLKLRIREEERSFKGKEGEQVTYNQPVVLEYLGTVDGASAPKAESPKAVANGDGGDDEKRAAAVAIAKESDDLIAHMDRVSKELGLPLDHAFCSAAFWKEARA